MPLTQELSNTLTLILAGGTGNRLKPLTAQRAKPAVPFGGAYRIIDFTLSNCIHSGLRRIHVLTQYQARSLEEHIRFGWNFLPRRLSQFISVRPPHHGGEEKWYHGTADAIYQNIDTILAEQPDQVMILSGDHLYKMDYGLMLKEHVLKRAALTIGAVETPQDEAFRFGILECDATGQVKSFIEKPSGTAPEIPGTPGQCYGSMGIYVFDTRELIRRLQEDADLGPAETSHDFGKDIIPRMIEEVPVIAHHFTGVEGPGSKPYWRDVGTIEAFFEANMDLCDVQPKFNLYDTDWPIYTLWHNDPPAKTVFDEQGGRRSEVANSLLCNGTIVSGAKIHHSILSNRVYVGEESKVDDSLLFSGVRIGSGCRIKRAIVDKWVEVPDGTDIGYDEKADAERFTVSETGIVVIPQGYKFV